MGWFQHNDVATCPYCLPLLIAAIGFGLYAVIVLLTF